MVDWVQICSLEFSVGVREHSECVKGIQRMEGEKVVTVSLDSCCFVGLLWMKETRNILWKKRALWERH